MSQVVVTGIILAHRFVSPPGWKSDEYALARTHHGIVYGLEGHAAYRLAEGTHFELCPGDCLYLPPGTRYITVCGEDEPFVHMTVNFDLIDQETLFPAWVKRHLSASRHFEQAFSGLVRHWSARHPHYQQKCMGLLYELIYLLQCEMQAAPSRHMRLLEPACAYLDEHFLEAFALEELSGMCGMSPTYFRRLFHSVFHETPAEYRRRLRIAHAEDLLLTGQYSLDETAQLCGYPDPAYFSRVFKKTYGVAPSRWARAKTQDTKTCEGPQEDQRE